MNPLIGHLRQLDALGIVLLAVFFVGWIGIVILTFKSWKYDDHNKHKSSDPDCWKCRKKVFAAKAKEMRRVPPPRRDK